MKLKIILALLLTTLFVKGQSFTNTVNIATDNAVFNYNYGNNSEHIDINKPIYFFMTFAGPSGNISGELKHLGESFTLFSSQTLSGNKVVISPIDAFFGEHKSGNWQLKIESTVPFFIESWGIGELAPEPTSMVLLGLGGLLLFSKKYEKNS
jgi:hypothetical protein